MIVPPLCSTHVKSVSVCVCLSFVLCWSARATESEGETETQIDRQTDKRGMKRGVRDEEARSERGGSELLCSQDMS